MKRIFTVVLFVLLAGSVSLFGVGCEKIETEQTTPRSSEGKMMEEGMEGSEEATGGQAAEQTQEATDASDDEGKPVEETKDVEPVHIEKQAPKEEPKKEVKKEPIKTSKGKAAKVAEKATEAVMAPVEPEPAPAAPEPEAAAPAIKPTPAARAVDGTLRQTHVAANGVPGNYANASNPVASTPETLAKGEVLFQNNCVICHGKTGMGDGPAGQMLKPPASNLSVVVAAPATTDGYLFWTITEGGGVIKTAMPSFKSLPEQDRWTIIRYLREKVATQ